MEAKDHDRVYRQAFVKHCRRMPPPMELLVKPSRRVVFYLVHGIIDLDFSRFRSQYLTRNTMCHEKGQIRQGSCLKKATLSEDDVQLMRH